MPPICYDINDEIEMLHRPFKCTVMKERLLSDSVQTVYDQGQWMFITLKDVSRRKSDTLLD